MLEVFVVTVVVSIALLKVTAMVEFTATEVSESEGEVEETVGAVVSNLKAYDSKAGMVAEMPRWL